MIRAVGTLATAVALAVAIVAAGVVMAGIVLGYGARLALLGERSKPAWLRALELARNHHG